MMKQRRKGSEGQWEKEDWGRKYGRTKRRIEAMMRKVKECIRTRDKICLK